ncbi:MAG TPA: DUF2958 domain-containing protein [Anaerolineae bacterium]|nr:DUF2958 domain-containing protein [Anaerolineae bacterium]
MDIPPLYTTEGEDDPLVVIKLFTPDSNWTWYVIESDGDTCFGLVCGHAVEMGYFALSELRDVRGPLGLRIERDLWWEPRPLSEVKDRVHRCKPGGLVAAG